MLSKFQANVVADALLDNAESRRLERLNAATQPVYWLNRCPEINPLQPWQRELVVQVAMANVGKTWLFHAVQLTKFAALGLFLFIDITTVLKTWWMLSFIAAGWVVPWIVQSLFLRREVRRVAVRIPPSWSSSSDEATQAL